MRNDVNRLVKSVPEPISTDRENVVQNEMNCLNNCIEKLESLNKQLNNNLDRVLSHDIPTSGTNNDEEVIESTVPLAADLEKFNYRLNLIIKSIASILDRLHV